MAKASGSAKRTYRLSLEILTRFEHLVPSGERSHAIEQLMAEEVEEQEIRMRRADIEAGLRHMADVYDETSCDWQFVDREGWPAE